MGSDTQCTLAEAVALFRAQLLREAAATRPTADLVHRGIKALAAHWPEYLIEASCLGTFVMLACLFAVLLEHPASPIRQSISNAAIRHLVAGMAMGLTAITLIYSRLGIRSGAHMNPAVTLTYFRLNKVQPWDTVFYALSQFVGALAGAAVAFLVSGAALAHEKVNFAITRPGILGEAVAFFAEATIAFLMMSAVLRFSNSPRLSRYTGCAAGVLVMLFITFEGPLSGMSMNPARSFATDFVGMQWRGLWIYFTAPLLGMMIAAEFFIRTKGAHSVICAKLNHHGSVSCIFRCGYREQNTARAASA